VLDNLKLARGFLVLTRVRLQNGWQRRLVSFDGTLGCEIFRNPERRNKTGLESVLVLGGLQVDDELGERSGLLETFLFLDTHERRKGGGPSVGFLCSDRSSSVTH